MDEGQAEFERRLKRLAQKPKRASRDYATVIGDDGLIVIRPHRARVALPIRQIAYLVVALVLFKAFLMAALGEVVYESRVSELRTGSTLEQMGSWVMEIDPLTQVVADYAFPYLRGGF